MVLLTTVTQLALRTPGLSIDGLIKVYGNVVDIEQHVENCRVELAELRRLDNGVTTITIDTSQLDHPELIDHECFIIANALVEVEGYWTAKGHVRAKTMKSRQRDAATFENDNYLRIIAEKAEIYLNAQSSG